jgi:hypothetical protein
MGRIDPNHTLPRPPGLRYPRPMLWWTVIACHAGRDAEARALALAPLEPNQADWPTGAEPYPEELSIVSGGDSDLWWADARGYVQAPIGDVWAAALDPEVGVDRREVDEWSYEDQPDDGLDAVYLVHITVHDVITVNYDLLWKHEVQEGTADDPTKVVAVWSKVDGTSFIDILQGSLVLRAVDGQDVTQVELEEELKAALRDDATLVAYLQDFFDSLVAASHGRPLPEW